jgi:hypothetical protein
LAEFDNMLLSYADRTRIIADGYRKRVFTENGIIRAAVLVDGFVCGIWKIVRERGAAALIIELFEPIAEGQRTALTEEGSRLLDFVAPDADAREIRLIPAE